MKSILTFLLTLLLAPSAWAATIYIDSFIGPGNCIGSYNPPTRTCGGGSQTAYGTVSAGITALDALSASSTLLIRSGTYDAHIDMYSGSWSGTSGNNTWIGAYSADGVRATTNNETVVIKRPEPGGSWAINIQGQSYITLDHLKFDGNGIAGADAPGFVNGQATVRISGATNLTLQNLEAYGGCAEGGFSVGNSGETDNITWTNVSSHDNMTPTNCGTPVTQQQAQGHGFYIHSSGHTMDGLNAYNNGQLGIQVYDSSVAPSNVTIKNSYFHDNGLNMPAVGGGGNVFYGSNHQIHDNVFANEPGAGSVSFGNGGNNVAFYNNTVFAQASASLVINGGGSGHTVKNNIFSQTSGGDPSPNITQGASVTFSNNLCSTSGTNCVNGVNGNVTESSATTFLSTSSASADFLKLKTGSAAIGSATAAPCLSSTDKAGLARPQNGTCDMGAYEFASGAPPAPAVAITGPASTGTYVSANSTEAISGTSSCNGSITSVTWTQTVSGSTVSTGTATGTTSWSISSGTITFTAQRVNTITARVNCADSSTASATLQIGANGANRRVVELNFDDNTGTTAADSSGLGNDATFGGSGNTWIAGKYGFAVSANGSGYLSIPDDDSLDLFVWTISAWIRVKSSYTDYHAIMRKNPNGADTDTFLFASISGGLGCGADGSVAGGFHNSTIPYRVACTSSPISINAWHHVAYTYDGANNKLYIDGSLISTTAATELMTESTGTLQILSDEFSETCNCDIDQFAVDNYAMSLAQVQTEMANDRSSLTPAAPSLKIGDKSILVGDKSVKIGG